MGRAAITHSVTDCSAVIAIKFRAKRLIVPSHVSVARVCVCIDGKLKLDIGGRIEPHLEKFVDETIKP